MRILMEYLNIEYELNLINYIYKYIYIKIMSCKIFETLEVYLTQYYEIN